MARAVVTVQVPACGLGAAEQIWLNTGLPLPVCHEQPVSQPNIAPEHLVHMSICESLARSNVLQSTAEMCMYGLMHEVTV
jgi:hypothetical protein